MKRPHALFYLYFCLACSPAFGNSFNVLLTDYESPAMSNQGVPIVQQSLCEVRDLLSPFDWTPVHTDLAASAMTCNSGINGVGGQVAVVGTVTDAGNPYAYVGDINSQIHLPSFPGAAIDFSDAQGIRKEDDLYLIVGSAINASGQRRAFFWDQFAPGNLVDLGCALGASCVESRAYAIAGEKVEGEGLWLAGSTVWAAGLMYRRAAVFDGTTFITLNQPTLGDSEAEMLDLNLNSKVGVGYSGKRNVAFRFSEGNYDSVYPAIWFFDNGNWDAHPITDPIPAWCDPQSAEGMQLDMNRAYAVARDTEEVWGGSYCGRAFIADGLNEPADLRSLLLASGVSIPSDYLLHRVTGIDMTDASTVHVVGTGDGALGVFAFEANVDHPFIAVPEPDQTLLLLAGVGLLGYLRRRSERL